MLDLNLNSFNDIKKIFKKFGLKWYNQRDYMVTELWQLILTLNNIKKGFLFDVEELDNDNVLWLLHNVKNAKNFSSIVQNQGDNWYVVYIAKKKLIELYKKGKITRGQILGYGACAENERKNDNLILRYYLNIPGKKIRGIKSPSGNKIVIIYLGCSEKILENNIEYYIAYKKLLNEYFDIVLGIGKITLEIEKSSNYGKG
jgi:hypothetical protein